VNLLALAVIIPLFALQVVLVITFLAELRRLAEEAAGAGGSGVLPDLGPNVLGLPGRDLTSLAIALWIVTGLVVVLVALAIRWRLQDARWIEMGDGDRQASTVAAIEVSLEAIRREPDPRRAVIVAYAAMERSLSGAGFGRRRSEAPLEYLRRVLAAPTRTAEEVRTITLLFQHAKFSQHAVDEAMRNGAINALERIRMAAGGPA
jgi:hypothetical protein